MKLNMKTHQARPNAKPHQHGFSLVELMIGLTLGLFVIGGVIAIFSATQQANRATEGLSRSQETSRLGFELMARSLREAGGTLCSTRIPVLNALAPAGAKPAALWWLDPSVAIRGFDNGTALPATPNGPPASGAGSRIAGTDAVHITTASLQRGYNITAHSPAIALPPLPANTYQLNTATPNLQGGDLVMACDFRQGALFQARTVAPVGTHSNVVYDTAAGLSPGNASVQFGFPAGTGYNFMRPPLLMPAILAPFTAELWYIGQSVTNTGPARRSLYRMGLTNTAGTTVTLQREEILEGVTDMQITYLMNSPVGGATAAGLVNLTGVTDYVPADATWTNTRWEDALAVRITLTVEVPTGSSTRADVPATADIQENLTTQRILTQTITLRDRLQ